MFKRLITFGAVLVILFGYIFGSPGEMTGKPPEEMRIVSLAPSLTESLYLLGAGDRLKGCTTYCLKPEAAQKKEKIGTLIDFNVEKIVALKPNLVLGMEFSDRRAIEKLKNLGFHVELFPSPKNFAHLCESFLRLGKILGTEEKAREIVNAAKQEVTSIRQLTAKAEKIKIFWQLGAKPLFAATKGYFTNDYIEFAGGINIAADAPSGIYSREEVLKRNPDVIIIITMGIASEEEKKNWQNYNSINAVKNNRIYIVDSYTYCSPTPRSFVQALKELLLLLRPAARPAARGAFGDQGAFLKNRPLDPQKTFYNPTGDLFTLNCHLSSDV